MKLESYFSDRKLLKILCNHRALLTKKRHDKQFFNKLVESKKSHNVDNILYDIFPPRSKWVRIGKNNRVRTNTLIQNKLQLENTVLKLTNGFQKKLTDSWYKNLMSLLEDIRRFALSPHYHLPRPEIYSQFKKEDKLTKKKYYRPIAYYKYFDRIIISQYSKYLTDLFDSSFLDCSYAFRSSRSDKEFSHHKAIENIIDYKSKYGDVWVTECDIKKFYDSIRHDVIESIFNKRVTIMETKGIHVDDRAIRLLKSYLDSYSFNKYVKLEKENQILKANSEFEYLTDNELYQIAPNHYKKTIGIPQGGAISCFIANLLMNEVDEMVINSADEDLFYARFCDDMVIIHPDKSLCEKALIAYINGLKKVKLIAHQPESSDAYNRDFWNPDLKSKLPYEWSKNNVPWLSFLGYQVSHDLKVRIRKKSIEKERKKQVEVTDKVINLIKKENNKFNVSRNSLKFRLKQRLLSMSVGRIKKFNNQPMDNEMSWCGGFRVLKTNKFVKYQIKKLDRSRCTNLARFDNHINDAKISRFSSKNDKPIDRERLSKFYGSPFSYYYQFIKEEKENESNNKN